MANLRDDFVGKVKEKLRARVGNKCSNPDCRVYTTGPGTEDKINNIGVAAHICAASPGGPRYDLNMTVKERKSFDNGIWLCANCSIDIDRDVERYTVQLLKKWKKDAEDKARNELGKKAAEPDDAINTVAMALTGYPKSFLSQSIENVHKAAVISLEEKDPRFKVSSRFDGKNTIFTLNARSEVSMTASIPRIIAKSLSSDYKKFIEAGETLHLSTNYINISGSPLIEEIMSERDGKLSISTETVKALVKLSLVNSDTGIVMPFDDISGVIHHGTKQLVFKGGSYEGLLTLELKVSLSDFNGGSNFSVKFSKWNGIDVNKLPFFNKLHSFFNKIYDGWHVDCNIEIEGESAFYGSLTINQSHAYIGRIKYSLNYIYYSRIISTEMSKRIYFSSEYRFSAKEYKELRLASDLLQKDNEYSSENIKSNSWLTIIMNDNIRSVLSKGGVFPECFRIDADDETSLYLFGVHVMLPRKRFILRNIEFKIHRDIHTVNNGEKIKVEIIPGEGFIGREQFVR